MRSWPSTMPGSTRRVTGTPAGADPDPCRIWSTPKPSEAMQLSRGNFCISPSGCFQLSDEQHVLRAPHVRPHPQVQFRVLAAQVFDPGLAS